MNRFAPNLLNGISISIDNFYFVEQLVTDGLKALTRDIGLERAKGFKITGAVVTNSGDDKVVTAGWICLEGEVLQVDAHTADGPLGGGESWFWDVEETDDTTSQDEDADGATIYVNKKRRGKVVRGATPADFMPIDAWNYSEARRSADDSGWQELTAPAGYVGTVETRKFNGCLWFRGSWTNLGNAAAQVTLPADRRPEGDLNWYVGRGINGDAGQTGQVSFSVLTGKINVPGGFDVLITFNEIPPVPLM